MVLLLLLLLLEELGYWIDVEMCVVVFSGETLLLYECVCTCYTHGSFVRSSLCLKETKTTRPAAAAAAAFCF